jgi:hypothetical protein
MNTKSRDSIIFDRPAFYSIRVQGYLDPSWSNRLEGMTISASFDEMHMPLSTLEGEISDQSALAGVLNTLYEFHLPVISVERVDSPLKDK